jgi:hypothetical protein
MDRVPFNNGLKRLPKIAQMINVQENDIRENPKKAEQAVLPIKK